MTYEEFVNHWRRLSKKSRIGLLKIAKVRLSEELFKLETRTISFTTSIHLEQNSTKLKEIQSDIEKEIETSFDLEEATWISEVLHSSHPESGLGHIFSDIESRIQIARDCLRGNLETVKMVLDADRLRKETS